jgi:predicted O-methyltransferase YrrM
MPTIRGLARRLRSEWRAVQSARLQSRLAQINFQSGLGDSSFLLYGLVKAMKPSVVVEIGSARGRSACFMAAALKENGKGKLYAIDPHTTTAWNDCDSVDTYEVLLDNLDRSGVREYVEVLRSTSDAVSSNWTSPIDLLFIDGDHSYEGVKHDWEQFASFMQPHGAVVFHDTLWDLRPDPQYSRPDMGVPRFVDELRRAGYPVLTFENHFGVSVVQPVKSGVVLCPNGNE